MRREEREGKRKKGKEGCIDTSCAIEQHRHNPLSPSRCSSHDSLGTEASHSPVHLENLCHQLPTPLSAFTASTLPHHRRYYQTTTQSPTAARPQSPSSESSCKASPGLKKSAPTISRQLPRLALLPVDASQRQIHHQHYFVRLNPLRFTSHSTIFPTTPATSLNPKFSSSSSQ